VKNLLSAILMAARRDLDKEAREVYIRGIFINSKLVRRGSKINQTIGET